MKYRKKPVVVEASSWFRNGDHPADAITMIEIPGQAPFQSEGKVVRYYCHPSIDGQSECQHCKRTMRNHGWIDTPEGGHTVCPGDYIITGVKGEHYPCKPDIFEMTYDPAPE